LHEKGATGTKTAGSSPAVFSLCFQHFALYSGREDQPILAAIYPEDVAIAFAIS
jgi:hypothetical protein